MGNNGPKYARKKDNNRQKLVKMSNNCQNCSISYHLLCVAWRIGKDIPKCSDLSNW